MKTTVIVLTVDGRSFSHQTNAASVKVEDGMLRVGVMEDVYFYPVRNIVQYVLKP